MKKILSLLLLVVGMASCSNNEDLFDSNSKKTESTQVETFKVSPEEAKEELVGFSEQDGYFFPNTKYNQQEYWRGTSYS